MTEEGMKRQKKREKEVKRLRGFIIGSALFLSAGGAGYGIYKHKTSLTVSKIDREIAIHTNNYEIGGERLDAYSEHGCEFEGEGAFEDRMAERMRDEGYSEKTIEAAVQKFDLMYEHNLEAANEINLKQIEKSSKKTK